MWVGGQGEIRKVAEDGSVLASTSFIGLTQSLVFDGTNMWAAQASGTQVSRLRLSDGAFLGAYNAGNGTYGLAFDGANIWVTNFNDYTASKI